MLTARQSGGAGICPIKSARSGWRAFLAPYDSLRPRRIKLRERAAEGFGEFEEFVILDAPDAAFDLRQHGAANVPSTTLTDCGKAGLADSPGDSEAADL